MDKTTVIYGKYEPSEIKHIPLPHLGRERLDEGGLILFASLDHKSTRPRSKLIPRTFGFYGISQLTAGRGWRWVQGREERQEVTAGSIIVTTPGLVHDYGGEGTDFIEDALSFYGPAADRLSRAGLLREGVYPSSGARDLQRIIDLSLNPSSVSQIGAEIRLQSLLVSLYNRRKGEELPRADQRIQVLLDEMEREPWRWWQVKEMARFCCLSESRFRVKFRGITGHPPKSYIDSLKNTLACRQLLGSDNSVENIARSLGYVDPLHFSRRFRMLTGLSPTEYREHMGRV